MIAQICCDSEEPAGSVLPNIGQTTSNSEVMFKIDNTGSGHEKDQPTSMRPLNLNFISFREHLAIVRIPNLRDLSSI